MELGIKINIILNEVFVFQNCSSVSYKYSSHTSDFYICVT